ncbi:MAG: RdgB/HAM1 family non-canonical purine NTP pyrophosphatase [Lentisphaerota bacterium]
MKLMIATRNPHKLDEIRQIFHLPGLILSSALDHPELPDVEEDGETFEENAIKKAVTLAQATGLWALADDSGLEVEALDQAPGVRSARYAGEPVSYPANNRKLLQSLDGLENRRARFRCVMALYSPSGKTHPVEGQCTGTIARAERGGGGFGYDPLFVPDGYSKTFSEMEAGEKNALSHRGMALAEARKVWGVLLAGDPADWP